MVGRCVTLNHMFYLQPMMPNSNESYLPGYPIAPPSQYGQMQQPVTSPQYPYNGAAAVNTVPYCNYNQQYPATYIAQPQVFSHTPNRIYFTLNMDSSYFTNITVCFYLLLVFTDFDFDNGCPLPVPIPIGS